jgi:CRP-like cAMP-binding protein
MWERAMPDKSPPTNRILARLSKADFALIEPLLSPTDLPLRKKLEERQKPIEHVYFPDSGILSVVANGDNNRGIEVGLIGREGMSGLAVVMGADRTPHQTFVQVAGHGWKIRSNDLRTAIDKSATLHRKLLLYGHAFLLQTGYTAMANGRSKIEERLARWLLMAHDRVDGDILTLTHDFLSIMLGVRRPGVTHAVNLLERTGLIHANRGTITIVDRSGLEESSNGAYGAPEAEFNRLFG